MRKFLDLTVFVLDLFVLVVAKSQGKNSSLKVVNEVEVSLTLRKSVRVICKIV